MICLSIDAESESGSVLAKKYSVRGYPTLLFLNHDASPRDVIGGYMPAEAFLNTVRRIESGEGTIGSLREKVQADPENLEPMFALLGKLKKFNDTDGMKQVIADLTAKIEAGRGFDPRNLDSVFALYQDLQRAGLPDLAKAQAVAMKRLDPEGKSLALRRLKFEDLAKGLRRPEDLGPLREFLKDETYNEVLFDGWYAVYSITDRAAKRAKKDEAKFKALRKEARVAAVTLWKHTPEKHHPNLGNAIAWGFYEDADDLNAEEKAFALSVAEVAVQARGTDANIVDTYACCLFINGKVEEALKQVERCIELAPDNEEWLKRKKAFLESTDS